LTYSFPTRRSSDLGGFVDKTCFDGYKARTVKIKNHVFVKLEFVNQKRDDFLSKNAADF
jgi:hypothetical protein